MKVLMAEVNISEGKDLDLVEQVKAALLDGEAVEIGRASCRERV